MGQTGMGQRMKQRRIELGMTLDEVGQYAGVGRSTVLKWESGKISNMRRDKIVAVAVALKTTPAYLMGWEKPRGIRIKVYGEIAAGVPIDAVEDLTDDDPDNWEEITNDMARNGTHIALRIKGDSMEPRIKNGDVVIIRLQPTVENGEIAAVLVNGDMATCKKVLRDENGITLVSLNPSYDPIHYTNRQICELPVSILGKVVELRGKF